MCWFPSVNPLCAQLMHPFWRFFSALDCRFPFYWQLLQTYSFSKSVLTVALKNQHTLLYNTDPFIKLFIALFRNLSFLKTDNFIGWQAQLQGKERWALFSAPPPGLPPHSTFKAALRNHLAGLALPPCGLAAVSLRGFTEEDLEMGFQQEMQNI